MASGPEVLTGTLAGEWPSGDPLPFLEPEGMFYARVCGRGAIGKKSDISFWDGRSGLSDFFLERIAQGGAMNGQEGSPREK